MIFTETAIKMGLHIENIEDVQAFMEFGVITREQALSELEKEKELFRKTFLENADFDKFVEDKEVKRFYQKAKHYKEYALSKENKEATKENIEALNRLRKQNKSRLELL